MGDEGRGIILVFNAAHELFNAALPARLAPNLEPSGMHWWACAVASDVRRQTIPCSVCGGRHGRPRIVDESFSAARCVGVWADPCLGAEATRVRVCGCMWECRIRNQSRM